MTILITGASSGFGASLLSHLSSLGHTVIGTSRHPAADSQLLKLDVRDPENCRQIVSEVILKHGRIDVLINNAGMGLGGAAELTTTEEFHLQMETNFFGTVNMCRAVLPTMRKFRCGKIVNFSSIAGRFAIPYQGPYSCSKFAINAYSQALALETRQFNIDVLLIEPGDFATGFTSSRINSQSTEDSPDYRESYLRTRKCFEHDETNGAKPDYLAKKIAKIIKSKHPKFHNVITPSLTQQLSVFLFTLLPSRLSFAILRKFYRV